MHFRAVKEVLKPPRPNVDVGVDIHPPDGVDDPFHQNDLGGCTEQDDRSEFDGLVDKNFKRMRTGAGQPVDIADRVVSFMNSVQMFIVMLPSVKQIDIQVVGYKKQ